MASITVEVNATPKNIIDTENLAGGNYTVQCTGGRRVRVKLFDSVPGDASAISGGHYLIPPPEASVLGITVVSGEAIYLYTDVGDSEVEITEAT